MATFALKLNKYTITFKDEDGSVLCSDEWDYGTIPSCEQPTKQSDEQYTYVFAGWEPKVTAVKDNATYTATYTPVPLESLSETYVLPTTTKVLINGQIYIHRGDKTYTLTGQVCEN